MMLTATRSDLTDRFRFIRDRVPEFFLDRLDAVFGASRSENACSPTFDGHTAKTIHWNSGG
jgi:hypothetical protein